MVVWDIRDMSPPKVKQNGANISFYLPVKAMVGPTDPFRTTQSEVDSLSGVRAPRDESGLGTTKEGPENESELCGMERGPVGGIGGPIDEAGRLRTNQVLRPVGPTRTPQDESGHHVIYQGPAGWVRAPRD